MGQTTVLSDRFEILRTLGNGATAEVFEARDKQSGKHVAVKLLRESVAKDPDVLARFQREANVGQTLKGPHAVEVLSFAQARDGRPYLVMELLIGHDLGEELERRGPLPLEEAAGYLAQACNAMMEAHAAGVVHRDLKPANLFLTSKGQERVVKVLDFGISKLVKGPGDGHQTHAQASFGSPLYMSPETFKSTKDADERSDVWALGVIFYEMLTCKTPFVAQNALGVGLAVMHDPEVPATARRPELPRAVDVVIARALKKDPAKRYQTVSELLAAIEVFLPQGRNNTMVFSAVGGPDESDNQRTAWANMKNVIAQHRGRQSLSDDSDQVSVITQLRDVRDVLALINDDSTDDPTQLKRVQPPPNTLRMGETRDSLPDPPTLMIAEPPLDTTTGVMDVAPRAVLDSIPDAPTRIVQDPLEASTSVNEMKTVVAEKTGSVKPPPLEEAATEDEPRLDALARLTEQLARESALPPPPFGRESTVDASAKDGPKTDSLKGTQAAFGSGLTPSEKPEGEVVDPVETPKRSRAPLLAGIVVGGLAVIVLWRVVGPQESPSAAPSDAVASAEATAGEAPAPSEPAPVETALAAATETAAPVPSATEEPSASSSASASASASVSASASASAQASASVATAAPSTPPKGPRPTKPTATTKPTNPKIYNPSGL